ncbi:MAG: guanylate kinase [Candidatus Omnitrophica bacterium]|nr:guanylate kinase [Candidatus Omnitrophota bacterium]
MKKKPKIKGLIFVVSGPSGSGKTTLLKNLLRERDLRNKLVKSVSVTTRGKRSQEHSGRDYFFVSPGKFQQLNRDKKILEWTKYLGYHYATRKDFVEQALSKGRHVILCLDFKGARKIKKLYPKNTITVFIIPPALKELRRRIEARCAKTKQEEVHRRLKLAKLELRNSHRYNYALVNKDLTKAKKRLKAIILKEILGIS